MASPAIGRDLILRTLELLRMTTITSKPKRFISVVCHWILLLKWAERRYGVPAFFDGEYNTLSMLIHDVSQPFLTAMIVVPHGFTGYASHNSQSTPFQPCRIDRGRHA